MFGGPTHAVLLTLAYASHVPATSAVETFDGIAAARCGDVLLVLWKLPATLERFAWLEERLAELERAEPSFVLVQLISSSSSPPDAKLRARVRTVLRGLEGRMRHLVSVPLGDALWMSVVRVIMRGMTLVSGQGQRSSVASSAKEAFDVVAAVAQPATPSRNELEETLLAMCVALGATRRELGI